MGGGQSKAKTKVLFLGLDNAGKTSIIQQLTNRSPHTTSPTRGFQVSQLEFEGCQLVAWDVGGQQSLRSHWSDYYGNVAGIFWIIDSTDRRRMFETGLELAALLKEPKLAGIPLLVFANKQDLATKMNVDEIATELELHTVRDRDFQIQGCSAIDGNGLIDGMHWMVTSIKMPPKKKNNNK